MFRTDNFINDIERNINWKPNKKGSLRNRLRKKFIKTYIFFDESNALANNREWEKFDKAFKYYLNQPRKNFETIYLIGADGDSNEKSFKKFVQWWYYVKPLVRGVPILENVGLIRKRQKDDFGNTKEEAYKVKNEHGIIVTEYIPVDVYEDWFYKPMVWQYYDDLHKNIPDDNKQEIEFKLLEHYFKIRPNLKFEMEGNTPELFKKYTQWLKTNTEEKTDVLGEILTDQTKKKDIKDIKIIDKKSKEETKKVPKKIKNFIIVKKDS